MKKNITIVLTLTALLMTISFPKANAQIFIADEDEFMNSNRSARSESELPFIPELGLTNDQYAPLGGGIALLGLLGGAYLIGKKRKEE